MIADFHKRNVSVLFPYNPWDSGTRDEGESDCTALTSLLKDCGADGFNGDTMLGIPQDFYQCSLDNGYPVALEPEGWSQYNEISWTPMGWGYWQYPYVPMVDPYKFLDGKHMTNVCNRWNT